MNSRERILEALNHHRTDRVPLDLGSNSQTGMQVSTVYKLRQALKLDPPGTPVKVVNVSAMLGEIKDDLLTAIGGDVVGLALPYTPYGYPSDDWKEWTTFDGTPVLVPGAFNTELDAKGELLQYPQGDRSVPASGRMPHGGFYFDAIVRQGPIDDDNINPLDNTEEFGLVSEADLAWLARETKALDEGTDKAIMLKLPGTGFGDVACVPGPTLRHPKGIRDIEEWYISLAMRPDYIAAVFERQCEIAIQNLERIFAAVGNRPTVVWVSGTDFGAQNGPLISPRQYRKLFMPVQKRINDWIHAHTTWKTFIHSCGSILPLVPDMIEAGWDILNPVQTSAENMDPRELKARFGDRVTFWGGGVDTQHTLPLVTPNEIRAEVKRNLDVFTPGGGYVFNTIHNVQHGVPVENLLAMYETVRGYRPL